MLLRHAIGAVLRRRRLEQGKTLRQLAEESRVSLPYLSEIERGRKEASSEILGTLCRVLDLTESQLLTAVGHEFDAAPEFASVIDLRGSRKVIDLRGSRKVIDLRSSREVIDLRSSREVGGVRTAGAPAGTNEAITSTVPKVLLAA